MKTTQSRTEMTIALLSLGFFALGCKDEGTTPPPPIPERVKLTLIDVSVKEAFLHVAVTNAASGETLAMQRDGATVMTFPAVADTNIADTSLTQTTTYQYTACLVNGASLTGTSNTISAQTLAPTSHNFTWQTFLLGDGNSSVLDDVALINDTDAIATGEIYLGGDPTRYNAAIWNGSTWSIIRVPYYYQGQQFYNPIQTVLAFSHDDIWFAGNGVIHWTGQGYLPIDISSVWGPDRINRMWGISGNDIYIVGDNGSMAHATSGTWQRLESGTTTNILDAWGVVNPVTGKEEVYCAASSFFEPVAEKKILRITGGTHVDSVGWINRLLTGVWTHAGYPIFTSGDGVFENRTGQWREIPTGIYTNDVRGTGLNNIVAVGDFGFITHYNGIDWQTVATDNDAGYATVRLSGNLVFAVGRKNGRGLIAIGRRQ